MGGGEKYFRRENSFRGMEQSSLYRELEAV